MVGIKYSSVCAINFKSEEHSDLRPRFFSGKMCKEMLKPLPIMLGKVPGEPSSAS